MTATSDGDLVTGTSDGTVRIWTRNPERAAPESERTALEKEVAEQKVDQYVLVFDCFRFRRTRRLSTRMDTCFVCHFQGHRLGM